MWNAEPATLRACSGTASRSACRCDENGDQLIGLVREGMSCAGREAQLVDQLEPVERLVELLGGDGYLVYEIGSTLRLTRFVVVGARRGGRAYELKSDVSRDGPVWQLLHHVDDVGTELEETFGNVTAPLGSIAHVRSSANEAEKLLPFRIPIPHSTFPIRPFLSRL